MNGDKIAQIILYTLFGFSILLLIIAFTGVNKLLVSPLEINEEPVKADVIIVLGGGVVKDTRSLPWSVQERARKGIELYRADYANNMIVAGGLVKGASYTESEIMRAYAEFLGVAPGDIFEEKSSSSTYENAVFSKVIMSENNWHTALLVTSDYHTQRACKTFKKLDIEVICLSAPPDAGFEDSAFRKLIDSKSIVREYLATVFYLIMGHI
ncbi:MAG: YdcF family protein [bacterium]|nr:YdcF family protein [bacterium]